MDQHPFPNCVHGVYVGGCGIDFMCHACEMGDEELSPNQAFAWAKRAVIQDMNAKTEDIMFVLKVNDENRLEGNAWHNGISNFLKGTFNNETRLVRSGTMSAARSAMAYLDECSRWAEHPDDADWIYRRYDHWVAEHNAMSGEDQFNALPDHVLDGSY